MQFKLDENLPASAADLLRGLGHDVITVYDQGLQSCTAPEVLAACQDEGKVLLSLDLDFSNILVYPPEWYAGLIVLRPHKPGPRAVGLVAVWDEADQWHAAAETALAQIVSKRRPFTTTSFILLECGKMEQ
jgi:hypothetical protein